MLKLAQENQLAIQGYFELRKEFEITSADPDKAARISQNEEDLSLKEICQQGLMISSVSEKNQEFMAKAGLDYI